MPIIEGGPDRYSSILQQLDDVQLKMHGLKLERHQLQEIQIRVNEIGMRIRSAAAPRRISE